MNINYCSLVNSGLLGCDALLLDKQFLTFQRIMVPKCSRVKQSMDLELTHPEDKGTTILQIKRSLTSTDTTSLPEDLNHQVSHG
jgi:hypothetical protein